MKVILDQDAAQLRDRLAGDATFYREAKGDARRFIVTSQLRMLLDYAQSQLPDQPREIFVALEDLYLALLQLNNHETASLLRPSKRQKHIDYDEQEFRAHVAALMQLYMDAKMSRRAAALRAADRAAKASGRICKATEVEDWRDHVKTGTPFNVLPTGISGEYGTSVYSNLYGELSRQFLTEPERAAGELVMRLSKGSRKGKPIPK